MIVFKKFNLEITEEDINNLMAVGTRIPTYFLNPRSRKSDYIHLPVTYAIRRQFGLDWETFLTHDEKGPVLNLEDCEYDVKVRSHRVLIYKRMHRKHTIGDPIKDPVGMAGPDLYLMSSFVPMEMWALDQSLQYSASTRQSWYSIDDLNKRSRGNGLMPNFWIGREISFELCFYIMGLGHVKGATIDSQDFHSPEDYYGNNPDYPPEQIAWIKEKFGDLIEIVHNRPQDVTVHLHNPPYKSQMDTPMRMPSIFTQPEPKPKPMKAPRPKKPKKPTVDDLFAMMEGL